MTSEEQDALDQAARVMDEALAEREKLVGQLRDHRAALFRLEGVARKLATILEQGWARKDVKREAVGMADGIADVTRTLAEGIILPRD